jgi:L-ascorbate metabolism protein UlaG (beta-lactamase superfamily)
MIALEWLGVAGFRITSESATLLIDPYVSRNRRARPQQTMRPQDLRSDAPIFLTHGHFDHIGDVPEIVEGTESVVYGSATALAPALRAGIPLRQLHPTLPDETIEFDGFQATAYASRHTRFDLPYVIRALRRVGWETLQTANLAVRYPAGQVLSWRFEIGGFTLHHLGSGGSRSKELLRLSGSKPDILLAPLQGHTRIHEIAVRYVEFMQPLVVIPHHHDDFYPPISESISLSPFIRLMHERFPHVRVIEPAIGQPITL